MEWPEEQNKHMRYRKQHSRYAKRTAYGSQKSRQSFGYYKTGNRMKPCHKFLHAAGRIRKVSLNLLFQQPYVKHLYQRIPIF